MKISKLFHWLYFTVMMLPIFILPIFAFAVRSDNNFQSVEITVQENLVVDFNQIADVNGNVETTTIHTGIRGFSNYDMQENHTYFIAFDITDTLNSNSIYLAYISQTYQYVNMQNNIINDPNPQRVILNYKSNADLDYRYIGIVNTTNGDMKTNNYMFVDLTQMFGYGNEPTAQVFYQHYPQNYYPFTISHEETIEGYIETYNDTDFASQTVYTLYQGVNKYFNYDNVFNFGTLYSWLEVNFFSGNAPLGFFIFWHLLIYWLLTSLLWLIFDILMYVPQLCHRWLDKASLE